MLVSLLCLKFECPPVVRLYLSRGYECECVSVYLVYSPPGSPRSPSRMKLSEAWTSSFEDNLIVYEPKLDLSFVSWQSCYVPGLLRNPNFPRYFSE